MPEQPVRDLTANGTLRTKLSPAVGPADGFKSSVAIDADGVLIEHGNQSTVVDRVYGDGRHYSPIMLSTPVNYQPGQYWLEKVGPDVFFAFVDDSGAIVYVNSTGGGPVPAPAEIPLTMGFPTLLAAVLVDSISVIEWGLVLRKSATAQRHHFRLVGAHNGTTISDATLVQFNQQGTIAIGVNDVTVTLTLTGGGAGQQMELRANAATTDWIASIVPERMVAPQ